MYLFGVSNFIGLELSVQFQVVLWGVFLCLLIFQFCKMLGLDKRFSLFALFMAALVPSLVRHSCLGQVDHHLFEMLAVLCLAMVLFQLVKSPSWTPVVLLPTLSFIFVQFSAMNYLVVLITYALISLFVLRSLNWGKVSVLAGLSLLLLLLAYQLLPERGVLFRMLGQQALRDLLILISISPIIFKAIFQSPTKLRVGIVFILLGLGTYLVSKYLNKMGFALAHIFGRGTFLDGVAEARSLFNQWRPNDLKFVHSQFSWLIYPTIALIPILLVQYWRDNRSRALLILFSIPFILMALLQRRYIPFFAPLFVIIAAMMIEFVWNYLGTLESKLIQKSWVILAACFFFAPIFQGDLALGFSRMHFVDFPIFKHFVAATRPDAEVVWRRLSGQIPTDISQSQGAIHLNPNMGTALMYLTGMGVTQSTFYSSRDLKKDLELRSYSSFEVLESRLKELKVNYLIVTDDLFYHEFLWKLLRQENFPLRMETKNPKQVVWDLDRMDQSAWYRLLLGVGVPKSFHRLGAIHIPGTRHFYERAVIYNLR